MTHKAHQLIIAFKKAERDTRRTLKKYHQKMREQGHMYAGEEWRAYQKARSRRDRAETELIRYR